ncbi:MAG: hypothetical protein RJA51_122 [Actinomycetota bacterium]
MHPADRKAADIIGSIEIGDERRQGGVLIHGRSRHCLENGVQQGREIRVGGGHAHTLHRATLAGHGRDDGERELVVTHGKVEEQLLHLGQHLFGPGILPVDLVDHEHGGEPAPERLGEHIARLREGTLGRVDEKHDAVH